MPRTHNSENRTPHKDKTNRTQGESKKGKGLSYKGEKNGKAQGSGGGQIKSATDKRVLKLSARFKNGSRRTKNRKKVTKRPERTSGGGDQISG